MAVTVLTPLAVEAWALRGALPARSVVRAGMGRRATRPVPGAGPVVIAGTAGALDPRLRAGDLVVASEVHAADGTVRPCPAAGPLVAALRRLGLDTAHGAVVSADRLVRGAARRELHATGALAVDLESARLVAAAAVRPCAVLRAVVDTDRHGLLHPRTPLAGLRALRALRAAAPALTDWAAAAASRRVLLAGSGSCGAGVDGRSHDHAVRAVARDADLVLVVGASNRSNSRLVEAAELEGARAHLVNDATEVDPRWLAGAATVGLTAGAGVPEELVGTLVRTLAGLGPIAIEQRTVSTEKVRFSLPRP